MRNRKWLGDIGLAVLIALPTGALTRPEVSRPERQSAAPEPHNLQLAIADRSSLQHSSFAG